MAHICIAGYPCVRTQLCLGVSFESACAYAVKVSGLGFTVYGLRF